MNVNLLTYHQVIFPQIQLMQSMVLSFMQRWLKLKKSVISRLNSTVEGNKNNNGATAVNSIAIGPDAKSSAVNGVSLGNNATSNFSNSTAIGFATHANGGNATAVGTNAKAVTNSTALGSNTDAKELGVAIGHTASSAYAGVATGQMQMLVAFMVSQ